MAQKRGLGKGLDALFIDNAASAGDNRPTQIRLNEIEPNRKQPRKDFDDEALQQLAESIREHGLIQPLVVRPLAGGGYQLIAGERRWRASRMAGLAEVPVVIMDIDDQKSMELALIENLQREDLNAIEEAAGYQLLMDTYQMTQAEVSKSVGKSRSAVANTLRLLNLPDKVQKLLKNGELSSGHARALLTLEGEDKIIETAQNIIKNDWTVRDIERFVQKQSETEQSKTPKTTKRDSYYDEIEIALKSELNRKVRVSAKGEKGKLEIPFYSREELAELAKKLAGNE